MITFNGHTESEYGLSVLDIKRPLLPVINNRTIQVPSGDGLYDFGRYFGERRIQVKFGINGTTQEDLQKKIIDAAVWLSTDVVCELRFDDEPEIIYYARVANAQNIDQVWTYGETSIEFICPSPYKYGGEISNSFISDSLTVNNDGKLPTPPRFMSQFIATSGEWKVNLSTIHIRIIDSFVGGDILEVNCATGAILKNGNRIINKLDWQSSSFFNLQVGENVLSVTPATVCSTTMYYRKRWL